MPLRHRLLPNAIRKGTGADFAGRKVVVAYNLHNCRVDAPQRPDEHCFTVRPSISGRVLAHVDEILLHDVEFLVRDSGLRRVRDRGVREVFAFARGTALDPRAALRRGELGHFDDWDGIAFNPFRDASFVLRSDRRVPVWGAEYVYFEGRRGIARGVDSTRSNPTYAPRHESDRIYSMEDLDDIVAQIGGSVG